MVFKDIMDGNVACILTGGTFALACLCGPYFSPYACKPAKTVFHNSARGHLHTRQYPQRLSVSSGVKQ